MKSDFKYGYSVLIKSKKTSDFLAHGGNGLPWFSIKWKEAQDYRKELLKYGLKGKVVPAIGEVKQII